ncbi:MAG: F0F1 ATP synthase subunit delta [Candidatus Binatia bacterium]
MLRFEWSTFVFQIVNFFILLAVLSRFFYRPLQRVMAQQEDEISSRLHEAEERARKADAEREELAQAAARMRVEAETTLGKAKADAAQAREHLLERARVDADRYLEEAKQRVQEMERSMQQRLTTEARKTAVTMTAQLMQAAAGPLLHQALLEKLLQEGLQLAGEQGELLRRAYAHVDGEVTIEVAYPPTSDLEERFRQIVTTALGADRAAVRIAVRTDPSLIAGARVLIGTVVIDLSLNRTLTDLSQQQTAVEEQT